MLITRIHLYPTRTPPLDPPPLDLAVRRASATVGGGEGPAPDAHRHPAVPLGGAIRRGHGPEIGEWGGAHLIARHDSTSCSCAACAVM